MKLELRYTYHTSFAKFNNIKSSTSYSLDEIMDYKWYNQLTIFKR